MGFLDFVPLSTLFLSALGSIFVWRICLVIYRVYFHPLAKIPGPRLAAATSFYIFLWNAFRPNFYMQIEKLHKIYGPIVRISPNEVHLSNPENYDKVYGLGTKFSKDGKFYKLTGTSAFGTPGNDLHRTRRAVLNPFFSRQKVLALEDVVQNGVSKLCQRMQNSFQASTPFNIHVGFRAISVDVITDYCFDSSYNLLDREDLGLPYFEMLANFIGVYHWMVQFPQIENFLLYPPQWVTKFIIPKSSRFRVDIAKNVLAVKKSMEAGEKMPEKTTIFHQLLSNDIHKVIDQSVEQLVTEGLVVVGAASDTVGATLVAAAYGVYKNPEIYQKVLAELTEAFPDPNVKLDFLKLEKLKYLTAVVKEALRIALPLAGRFPRLAPEGGAEFDGFVIPQGTSVSMSLWVLHRDPKIFIEPEKFNPDRWLDPDSPGLDKYLVPFSKGARICLGMPLAYCELYVTLGTIFRRYGRLGLSEMRKEDFHRLDYFVAVSDGRKLHVTQPSEDYGSV